MNAQREAAAAATATLTMAASQTTKRKVKDKTPVMEGQTEEERRILRQEQRTLYDRIGDRNVDLQDLDHDAFDEERNNNNNLFKKVRFNREVRRPFCRRAHSETDASIRTFLAPFARIPHPLLQLSARMAALLPMHRASSPASLRRANTSHTHPRACTPTWQ